MLCFALYCRRVVWCGRAWRIAVERKAWPLDARSGGGGLRPTTVLFWKSYWGPLQRGAIANAAKVQIRNSSMSALLGKCQLCNCNSYTFASFAMRPFAMDPRQLFRASINSIFGIKTKQYITPSSPNENPMISISPPPPRFLFHHV